MDEEQPPLKRIIYTSRCDRYMSSSELAQIIASSYTKNFRNNITSLLLVKQDTFFQVIEGPEAAVEFLFENICRDTRHWAVEPELEEFVSQRLFPRSPMIFHCFENVVTTHPFGFLRGEDDWGMNYESTSEGDATLDMVEQFLASA